MRPEGAVVVAVEPASPAARAGVQPGDRLLAINGFVPRDVVDVRLDASVEHVELETLLVGFHQEPVGQCLLPGVEVALRRRLAASPRERAQVPRRWRLAGARSGWRTCWPWRGWRRSASPCPR